MKHVSKLGLAMLFLGLAFSCKQASTNEEANAAIAADSTTVISYSAAVDNKDSNRKFVRTADLKFRVKNVAQSTYAIENIITKNGGFVSSTELKSNITEKSETKINEDSLLETTRFTVDNSITFRVPNTRLDTVLKSMVKEIDFLDTRLIKADDVSLQMLSNTLSQKRLNNHQKRLEKGIDAKGKKLNDVTNAEDHLLERKTENDEASINTLSLEDQVNFSTVTLYLYQRETTRQEVIANEKDINAYRPNIGFRIIDSLKTGWYILEAIIVFIFNLWAFIVMGVFGYFIYTKYIKK